jgi:phosphoglycerate dehydrogenase-like enzyme
MPTVLVTPTVLNDGRGSYRGMLREAGFDLLFPQPWDHALNEAELRALLPGVAAVIAGAEPYNAEVLAAGRDLRVIARVGVGYDAVDLEAATRRGVAVTIAPGANHETVAEHLFALMLALFKNIVPDHLNTKAGRWVRATTIPVRGQTMGIVGLGRIGKAVAVRARAFRMKVIAYELQPDQDFARQHDVELVSLHDLFRRADVVSLHVPATPQTWHLVCAETLNLMKPTAYLLNTSRGILCREADLVEALRCRRIAGAGLDVFDAEPPPPDHPLLQLDNVVLTPHTAGTDRQSAVDMAELAARSIIALARGDWPADQVVNPAVRERFRWSAAP